MEWIDVIQAISDGVMKGSTYAIIGIGFTLIFGVMHKLNLAYAAVSIAGAYASLTLINYFPETNVFIVFLMAVVVSGILGYLVYLLCFRFIPLANPLATLMETRWMLFFIEEIVVHATEACRYLIRRCLSMNISGFGGLQRSGDLLLVDGIGFSLQPHCSCICCTEQGLGIPTRAVAQQPIAARLAGISIEKTNAVPSS
ncbi:MAG: hypothetical protein Ct9H300mP16_10540 [Pseudomonadota bacterium]|nr:MAG: hypothetical protein Ct9H300mP16_10540 [Pseudomonadota bacterium]